MSDVKTTLSAPGEPVGNADDTLKAVLPEDPEAGAAVNEEIQQSADEAAPADYTQEIPEAEAGDAEQADELAGLSAAELVERFAQLLDQKPVRTLRQTAEAVKTSFYKLHRASVEAARREFIDNGGAETDFVPEQDPLELRLKDLLKEYRRRRDEFNAADAAEKEHNLEIKLRIIDGIKELTESDETLDTTFARFRELQQRWKETGPVPQERVKDLWESYNLQIDNFYGIIKINKELRDLDRERNLAIKTELCEKAEALMLEPSAVEAFRKLQKLHDEWRETGPTAPEHKEELWERFRAASGRINKAHQEYFDALKSEQVRNLELKTELCEKAEELLAGEQDSRRDWNRASEKLLEIQKVWKTIGFAPKKDNTRIYERFRTACDKFFEAKRNFYASVRDEMDENLRVKIEICEAAEALRDSDEWKKATDELIALQARWKTVGAVSRRRSDEIWKRFRAACDAFFERKAANFASQSDEQEENLRRKTELLEQMEAADIAEGGYEAIKEFQRRWSEIGFVPVRRKEEIRKRYKAAVDNMFNTLRGNERSRSMAGFKEKLAGMKASGDKRLRSERERLYNRVRQLEQDIATLENNIGFFARSKNAEALIADVNEKIERAKREMRDAVEKVRLIDSEEQA